LPESVVGTAELRRAEADCIQALQRRLAEQRAKAFDAALPPASVGPTPVDLLIDPGAAAADAVIRTLGNG
jgi:hypothetical protein